jgi:hypothetical protein
MIRHYLAVAGHTLSATVAVKIRGFTLRKIADIICDPAAEETIFVSQGYADVAVCLAEVDTSTDEEEDPDNVTGTF